MSKMMIVDGDGKIAVADNTLNPVLSDHPVFKARNALALPQGDWLYAPKSGHALKPYSRRHATPTVVEEFQKVVRLYLAPYGPEVTNRFITRGALSLQLNITKETVSG